MNLLGLLDVTIVVGLNVDNFVLKRVDNVVEVVMTWVVFRVVFLFFEDDLIMVDELV